MDVGEASSGALFGSAVDGLKESGSCCVESLGGLVVADAQGQAVESFEGDSWLEEALGLRQTHTSLEIRVPVQTLKSLPLSD